MLDGGVVETVFRGEAAGDEAAVVGHAVQVGAGFEIPVLGQRRSAAHAGHQGAGSGQMVDQGEGQQVGDGVQVGEHPLVEEVADIGVEEQEADEGIVAGRCSWSRSPAGGCVPRGDGRAGDQVDVKFTTRPAAADDFGQGRTIGEAGLVVKGSSPRLEGEGGEIGAIVEDDGDADDVRWQNAGAGG